MLIRDIYKHKFPVISFEIFPPKKEYPVSSIYKTIEELKDLNPDFISVTYGAGGGTKDRTIEIASLVKNKYGIEALAHLTCVSATKEDVNFIIDRLNKNNVFNILALRGDIPEDFTFDASVNYQYASDLVTHISSKQSCSIGAAAYPEKHIQSDSLEQDVLRLKEKVDCGVDFLISQLFFNNELFYDYMDLLCKHNIKLPISAGIMPVLNKNQIHRIVSLSGASLPKKFKRILEKYGEQPEAIKEAGIAYATEQIIDLLSWGVSGIHLYTMNKPEAARKIIENIKEIRVVLEKNQAAVPIRA